MNRRKSRDIAFQLVYAMEMSGNNKEDVIKKLLTNNQGVESDTWNFALELFDWTLDMTADLNESLKTVIEHWSVERLAKVDKSLIYLGCSEIEMSETPASIVIDEMIELAKTYGDKDSPSFVNAVIDSWRKKR